MMAARFERYVERTARGVRAGRPLRPVGASAAPSSLGRPGENVDGAPPAVTRTVGRLPMRIVRGCAAGEDDSGILLVSSSVVRRL